MIAFMKGRAGIASVAALLLLQIVLFWLSMDEFMEISVFCTGGTNNPLGWLFGMIHLLLLGLLFLGLLSLRVPEFRLPYIGLLAAALLTLPAQASLVEHHQLSCDAP
jgi:hypothetical protein